MNRTVLAACTLTLACTLALACGSSPESGSGDTGGSEPTASAGEEGAPADRAASAPADTTAGDQEAPEPLRTITGDLPDPCALLTAQDATELLGSPVGAPRSPDAGGFPCVYRVADAEGQMVLDMYIVRGADIDSWGTSYAACEGEIVTEVEGLGQEAALWRNTADFCGERLSLWVQTGVFYGGPARRYGGEGPPIEGYIHFLLSADPPADEETTLQTLRTAAERALERLPES